MRTNFLLLATKFGHQVHHVVEEAHEKFQVSSGDSFDELGHPFKVNRRRYGIPAFVYILEGVG